MARPEKIRLGDLLIQQKLITTEQLHFALDEQKRNGRKLGRVLADNGFITEEQISESLASQLNIPYINLKNHNLNLELVRQLPESMARRFRALPLEEHKGGLLVGMADPTDLQAFDELGQTLKRSIDIAVVTEGQLLETIERVYRRTEEISGMARGLSEELSEREVSFGATTDAVSVEETPVVNLLQSIFSDAVRAQASGIHLELLEGRMQLRFRIDGRLQLQTGEGSRIAPALVHRLKLMSGLDASEKRLPQDGHLNILVHGQPVDVLISTLPTQQGESVVMRLFNRGGSPLSLDKLGLPQKILERIRETIRRGSGMVLAVAPEGGGNIATLYAALGEIKAADRKIITVEDPVEYSLPGITQIQVDEKIGMNFPRALRSALRQDPDVVLLGDMRDTEIAQAGLRAAMDRRLVFSALVAQNAVDALFLMQEMEVPNYLVASSVNMVLAQRLLRRVCKHCSEPATPSAQEAAWLKHAGVPPGRYGELRLGRGCGQCDGSGYSGNLMVYELLEMDRALAEAVAHGDVSLIMQAAIAQMKGDTLLDRALDEMAQGRTSLAEVMHIGNRLEG